jgi:flavin reductase (DIM6/NTAB) family NADH-FMN oxidoreductase RutF
MSKIEFKPGTMLNPVPVVMVSCGDMENKNIITVAWTGIINSEPPMTYVSVRKERYSHHIIKETGEFVINLTTKDLAFATDYCGVKSGKDIDKFKEQNLTPVKSNKVSCPSIAESPVNLECKVLEVKEFPTHDMFIAEIISVSAEESLMDEDGKFCLNKAGLIAYNHGEYIGLESDPIGKFGYSVMKPKTKRRLEAAKGSKPHRGSANKPKRVNSNNTRSKGRRK